MAGPVMWLQGLEEMALPTCYCGSSGCAQPGSKALAENSGGWLTPATSTSENRAMVPSSGFQDTALDK